MPNNDKETLSAMTLARMSYFNIPAMRELLNRTGSFSCIIENHKNIQDVVPDCPTRLVSTLKNISKLQERAEEELEYCRQNGVKPLLITDPDYPQRLTECDDAPLVLFYKGTASLNKKRMISIVGTRHATVYADDCIRTFTESIRELCPDLVIVSGLAYGVDIMAHRHALQNGIPTVGVVAHGLDSLYPSRHRETANRMIENGGLLTEFFTRTNADKVNFVRRNRIVAGMCDATILVESAARGGGLITTSMAQSYNRDVFAYPGRIGDQYSEGCNNLIRDNGAALMTSADDLVKAMKWDGDRELAATREKGIERTLFPELEGDEKLIAEALTRENDLHTNILTDLTGIPVSRLSATLFEMEMKGIVRAMAGGVYHLLN